MVGRTDAFIEQLSVHSMLAAGAPGVQAVAPEFLLTQDESKHWFSDVALPDERARAHWIVKLPRSRHETDFRILRHESIYLQAAALCGLHAIRLAADGVRQSAHHALPFSQSPLPGQLLLECHRFRASAIG